MPARLECGRWFPDIEGMTERKFLHVNLARIVPSENMKRFHGNALQPTLFGEGAVVPSYLENTFFERLWRRLKQEAPYPEGARR